MASGHKKYAQPYCSKYVTTNTVDPIRSDEPPFIRNFPRFLYQLYERQTAFSLTFLNTFKTRKSKSASRKSMSTTKSPRQKTQTQTQQQQQPGFKTIGQANKSNSTKSPTASMPAIPSDFEHIFHYSEAS